MLLSDIFNAAPKIEIDALNIDSRKAVKNSLFFCLKGTSNDGHKYIPQAIKNKAVAIVYSEDLKDYIDGIAYIRVENVLDTLNQVVSKFYDHPSRKMYVYGITGTNGKSTVANIIRNIDEHFESCGYIGTIGIKYNKKVLAPGLTTPNNIYMGEILSDMFNENVKSVAIEVSSHGLKQNRVDAVDFDMAVFTNFTYDHLDFHGTMENYFEAKRKLFLGMKEKGVAIINKDDDKYSELKKSCRCRVVSYGIENECDYRAENIDLRPDGSEFDLDVRGKVYHVATNMVARYNVYNLIAAIAALAESGKDIEEVIKYAKNLDQVEGRLEVIDEGQKFNVIVDFAHTPDGLEKIFEYAKMITPKENSITAVFGSAGKRDKAKRPVFGEIASRYCDRIVLTEDDPRDEEPKEIAKEIKSGIKNTENIFIDSRYDAIKYAIKNAKENDTVLILGKGDEVFMHRREGKVSYIGDHNASREIIHNCALNKMR